MYGGKLGVAAGTLPFTGVFLNLSWGVLAAATMITAGIALLRLVPRREA
jgi:hypothetical protein